MTETVTESDARTAINHHDRVHLELPFVGEGEFRVADRPDDATRRRSPSYVATLTYVGGDIPRLESGDSVRVFHSEHGVIAGVGGYSVEVADIQPNRGPTTDPRASAWGAADAAADRLD